MKYNKYLIESNQIIILKPQIPTSVNDACIIIIFNNSKELKMCFGQNRFSVRPRWHKNDGKKLVNNLRICFIIFMY